MRLIQRAILVISLISYSCNEELIEPIDIVVSNEFVDNNQEFVLDCLIAPCTFPTPKEGFEAFSSKLDSVFVCPRTGMCSGKVFVGFVIDAQGLMRDVRILRGVGAEMDTVVVEAVRSMDSKWEPSICDGVATGQRMILPVIVANE